jgi:hypothetical protein
MKPNKVEEAYHKHYKITARNGVKSSICQSYWQSPKQIICTRHIHIQSFYNIIMFRNFNIHYYRSHADYIHTRS